MQLQVLPLLDRFSYSLAATVLAAAFVVAKLSRRTKLDAIPTVGATTWIGSLWAGRNLVSKGTDIIQVGYEKHKTAAFKVLYLYSWLVIVSGPKLVDELRRASDDELSSWEAINEVSGKADLVERGSYP